MPSSPIPLCTVRSCHQQLTRESHRLVCPNRHSFDVARSGYINLLQPQDRRSKNPGDTPLAVAGRRKLHDLGVTQPLLEGICRIVAANSRDIVLDIGSGDGFYLGNLTRQTNCKSHGIDISIPAIDGAARRYPDCCWIVANADRFIPYSAHTFSLVLSITARLNPAEFYRVLQPGGRLLVALPAADDLIELRGTTRDRVARTVETFASHFKLRERGRTTTKADLDVSAIEYILHSVYRPLRSRPLEETQVTFSLDLLLFDPVS